MGWSESLRLEMERLHPGIKVTTVAPSYIKTGMFDGAKAPLVTPLLEPEFLAGRVIEAVKNNEIMVMEPASVNLLGPLKGLLPTRVFDFVADKVFGVYNTMDEFKGRNG
jgi:short-subunit dehydrogenase